MNWKRLKTYQGNLNYLVKKIYKKNMRLNKKKNN